MRNPFEGKSETSRKLKESDIRRLSSEESAEVKASGAREISPEQVPESVKAEFKRLRDSLDGNVSNVKGTHEEMQDGVSRYRLSGQLRNETTRGISDSTFIANLTHGFYIKIIMTVDEKDGEIINSEVVRDQAGWGGGL
jgi:hypothetical protein